MSSEIIKTSFHMIINGIDLDDLEKEHFDKLEIADSFEETSMVTFKVQESNDFIPNITRYALGSEIAVYLNDDGQMMQVFQGEIIEVNKDYPAGDASSLEVVCYDLSYRMKRKTNKAAVYIKTSIQENVVDLVQYHGLRHVVIHPAIQFPEFMGTQSISFGPNAKNKTAWQAIHRIANTFGYKVFVRADTFFMVRPSFIQAHQEYSFELVYNGDVSADDTFPVISINSKIDIDEKSGQVKAQLWTKKDLESGAAEETGAEAVRVMWERLLNPSNYAQEKNIIPIVAPDALQTVQSPVLPSWLETKRTNATIGAAPDVVGKFLADYAEGIIPKKPMAVTPAADATAVGDPDMRALLDFLFPDVVIPMDEIFSEDQANAAAKAKLEEDQKKLTVATVELLGNPRLQKGHKHTMIINSFGDIGKADSGDYTIESVKHTIDASDGFMTELEMRRPFTATKDFQGTIK